MQNRGYNFLFFLVIAIIIGSCANRGAPNGGAKDILPPKIVKSIPENYSTNFTGKEIRIYFNEYIKTKNLSKQLVISPPMKTQPEITPLGSASKYVTIKIFDTLRPNTTYAFNFGNSIVDYNEENPFKYYRYVFSTGPYIDSLSVKGSIKDALNFETEDYVSVALYKVDSTYTDSLIYKRTPDYITNTLDSTTNFKIENVKAGTYMLRALKDKNGNNTFQQKIEKIAFYEKPITLPQDSVGFELKLFKEVANYRAIKPSLISGEKLAFGFEGDYKNMAIELLTKVTDTFKSRYYKQAEKDTLLYFYSPKLKVDSLIFKISNLKNQVIDTFTVKIKDNIRDSLLLKSSPNNVIKFNQEFTISGNIPFENFDESKISIRNKDSILVDFTTTYDSLKNDFEIKFKKEEDNKYNIELLPKAITDLFNNTNDTLRRSVRTQTKYSYFTSRVVLDNAKYPAIVQLTNNKYEVVAEQYVEGPKPIDFEDLDAGMYYLRVIYDENKNGKYDTGDYLKGIQPERVSYSPKQVEAIAGFDAITEFTLLD
ncbi:Ig-like domain-containing protein [Lacinutrix neustonica]|uniref:Ig-like domain-containing protein n=1 Tax=Lacinutrix neustonica TaxID=2980107 RepID=A0A9E8MVV9_9FLAO|nr:Ig-like domain-containing protein [Lacinutrix neustonica]WAC01245.1 Ig-like domain-containing protein [Lacinutrix neustonica]